LAILTSCSITALETEITYGETGWTDTAIGVDSCPLRDIDLFLVRLKSVT